MNGEKSAFLGTYAIQEKLGEGGGGVVYKAYHKRLKTEVVIKKLRRKSVDMQMNRQEADILKNLHHTYLPQVLDFKVEDGDVYTVMSYIPGRSLKELLEEQYPFRKSQLIRWGMQLCSALNYLHSQKPPVIHSDIKPSNIMLTPDGNICLIDFNISFFLDGVTVLGYTDGYTSPEQYLIALDPESARSLPGYSTIDERSDIYSAGATFCHLATGQKIKGHKEMPDRECLEERIGEVFAEVLMKAVQPDPNDRFQSAYEMFQAFQGIARKDRRYRRLLGKQCAVRAGLAVLLAGFVVLGGYGVRMLRIERVERYNDLVGLQKRCIEEQDFEREEKVYREAVKVLPSAMESYYQNAYALHEQKAYEECIGFIDYDILGNEKIDLLNERTADVYYLKADSHFLIEEYQEAADAYEKVFEYGGSEGVYYRDYAIALAYNGEPDKARKVLEAAVDHGLEEASIYYAKGEIEKSLGQNGQAAEEFRQCISRTEDAALLERAYVMLSRIYEEENDRLAEREVLREAREVLPVGSQMLVTERLIQADIDMADERPGDDGAYLEEAVGLLEEVVVRGWDSYDTHNNLVVLYERQGELGKAHGELEKMEALFGEDYNLLKRRAFLEIDAQEQKENAKRDYAAFARYYEKAVQLYKEQPEGSRSDTEMGLLEHVYRQVEEGGWL